MHHFLSLSLSFFSWVHLLLSILSIYLNVYLRMYTYPRKYGSVGTRKEEKKNKWKSKREAFSPGGKLRRTAGCPCAASQKLYFFNFFFLKLPRVCSGRFAERDRQGARSGQPERGGEDAERAARQERAVLGSR